MVDEIGQEEFVMIGDDMNGHVGRKVDGYEGVHGGKGYGVRNTEGEMLLEFADAMKLVVLNTWFTKNESKKVTYESVGNKTVIIIIIIIVFRPFFHTKARVRRYQLMLDLIVAPLIVALMKAECPFDSIVFCSLIQYWTRLESKTTTIKPKSRQEGMLKSPVLSLWLPWYYFSRLLRHAYISDKFLTINLE